MSLRCDMAERELTFHESVLLKIDDVVRDPEWPHLDNGRVRADLLANSMDGVEGHSAAEYLYAIRDLHDTGDVGDDLNRLRLTEKGALRARSLRSMPEHVINLPPIARAQAAGSAEATEQAPTWDLFIAHASEDKEDVARPLHNLLTQHDLNVWLDENELTLGDSLRRKIDHGLANSRYGLVILSKHFFAKEWPQHELDGLTVIESARGKVILPVWHGVDRDYVARFSPTLAGKYAASTSKGLEAVVTQVLRAMTK